jgi:CheY-like chemotaxis protein
VSDRNIPSTTWDPPASWERRSDLELLADQLQAIEAWHVARRAAEQATESRTLTREMRLDVSRRMEARRREQQALLDCAAAQLLEGRQRLGGPRPRAVLIHRNAWFCERVTSRLIELGVEVIAHRDNGADGIGVAVVEQPDLLLVEDALPTVPGLEVVRRVHRLAPHTVVGAHVAYADGVTAMLEAGATAAWTRQVPPADVAHGLVHASVRSGV